jgi:SAM-dependent methyltransferase
MDPGLLFDEIADQYDRVRPRYPAELFADAAALTDAPAGASVLEVGCGTGQATRDLLASGWRVHAVEPGPAMAARAEANTTGKPFTVDVCRFEDWDRAGRTFDVLFSATAYHWVAPEARWRLAAAALRPGGSVVLATNRTVAGGTFNDVYRASIPLHERYASELVVGMSPDARTILDRIHAVPPDLGPVWQAAEDKSMASLAGDLFDPPVLRSYQWDTTYTAADAKALLATYSPYLRIPPERREPLLEGMAEIIRTDFGGTVSRRYLAVLAVARKR